MLAGRIQSAGLILDAISKINLLKLLLPQTCVTLTTFASFAVPWTIFITLLRILMNRLSLTQIPLFRSNRDSDLQKRVRTLLDQIDDYDLNG